MRLNSSLREYLVRLENEGLLRSRSIFQEESELIHFDRNDYLSLSQDRRISQAYQEGYKRYPNGSSSSMLLRGYYASHQAVEKTFAEFLNVDACILFSSGYAANLAITALLGQLNVHCIIDKEVHASIYDGLNQAKIPFKRFKHNDIEDLRRKFTGHEDHSAFITEGVFSMSGFKAPLTAMAQLGAPLFVDEAHSIGILGHQGRGAVDLHGLTQDVVPLRMIAFGKAFASQGALIAGEASWINGLLQAGRSLIYSTAISPAFSYGLMTTLEVIIAADEARRQLAELIIQFRECVDSSGLDWNPSQTAIQQLRLGCPHLALFYAEELKKRGFSCSAIRAPTVSKKATGIRIILNANHKPHQITQLFQHLSEIHEHTSK